MLKLFNTIIFDQILNMIIFCNQSWKINKEYYFRCYKIILTFVVLTILYCQLWCRSVFARLKFFIKE